MGLGSRTSEVGPCREPGVPTLIAARGAYAFWVGFLQFRVPRFQDGSRERR